MQPMVTLTIATRKSTHTQQYLYMSVECCPTLYKYLIRLCSLKSFFFFSKWSWCVERIDGDRTTKKNNTIDPNYKPVNTLNGMQSINCYLFAKRFINIFSRLAYFPIEFYECSWIWPYEGYFITIFHITNTHKIHLNFKHFDVIEATIIAHESICLFILEFVWWNATVKIIWFEFEGHLVIENANS